MAELGLAIASIAASAASLSKTLFDFYKFTKHACEEASDIAISIDAFKAVLLELENVLHGADGICSEQAQATIRQILSACSAIFVQIEDILAPLLLPKFSEKAKAGFKERCTWYFKKNDVLILTARLDSVKWTLHLLISIISLASRLTESPQDPQTQDPPSPQVEIRLCSARDDVASTRNSLVRLSLAEEENSPLEQSDGSRTDIRATPLAPFLKDIVTLGSSNASGLASINSVQSSHILSERCRSIMGDENGEVEMLIERWTTISDVMSRKSDYTGVLSIKSNSQRSMMLLAQEQRSSRKKKTSDVSSVPLPIQRSRDAHKAFRPSASMTSSKLSAVMPPVTRAAIDVPREQRPKSPVRGEEEESPITEMNPQILAKGEYMVTLGDQLSCIQERRIDVERWLSGRVGEGKILEGQNCSRISFSGLSIGGSSFLKAMSTGETCESLKSTSNPRCFKKLIRTGKTLMQLRKYTEALSLFREAFMLKEQADIEDLWQLEFYLGIILAKMNQFDLAEKMLKNALSTQKEVHQRGDIKEKTEHFLCRVYSKQSKWKQASALYSALWQKRKKFIIENSTTSSANELAWRTGREYSAVLIEAGEVKEAVRVLQVLCPQIREGAKISDRDVPCTLDLARAYRQLDRLSEARHTLQGLNRDELLAFKDSDLLIASRNQELAIVAFQEQNYQEAHDLAIAASELRGLKLGKANNYTIESNLYLAKTKMKLEDLQGARSILEDVKPVAVDHLGIGHAHTISVHLQLAELLVRLAKSNSAEAVLETAFAALHDKTNEKLENRETLRLAEGLGSLIMNNAANMKVFKEQKQKLHRATLVYRSMYEGQKRIYGQRSEVCMQTGHRYGRLCILSDLPTAECVLHEVWLNRKRELGQKSPATIETSLQLVQVYFLQHKKEAAMTIIGPPHEIDTTLSGNLQCTQTIERTEFLALLCLLESHNGGEIRQNIDTLEKTVEARMQLHGMNENTIAAALRVADLTASRGNLRKSHQLYTAIFGNATNNNQPSVRHGLKDNGSMLWLITRSGISSSIMNFLLEERNEGNHMLELIIDHIASQYGQDNPLYATVSRLQALALFLQRDGQKSTAVLRKLYEETVLTHGAHHKQTRSSSYLLGFTLIANSLISQEAIPHELDKIYDAHMNISNRSFIIDICLSLALLLVQQHLDNLAIPLLRWNHRVLKRRYGRLSKQSLTSLAIMHAVRVSAWKIGRKFGKSCSKEGTRTDPRVFMLDCWDKIFRETAQELSEKTGDSVSEFTALLCRKSMKGMMWETYYRDMGLRLATSATGGVASLERIVGPFLLWGRGTRPNSPEKSRAWTIKSNDSQESISGSRENSNGLSNAPNRTFSKSQSGINAESRTGHTRANRPEDATYEAADPIGNFAFEVPLLWSAFGDSLVDLTSSSEDGVRKAEERMSRLHDELVEDFIGKPDIDVLMTEVDAMEDEAGVE